MFSEATLREERDKQQSGKNLFNFSLVQVSHDSLSTQSAPRQQGLEDISPVANMQYPCETPRMHKPLEIPMSRGVERTPVGNGRLKRGVMEMITGNGMSVEDQF